jgi:hypothetical protein
LLSPNALLLLNASDAAVLGALCGAISTMMSGGVPSADGNILYRCLSTLAHLVGPLQREQPDRVEGGAWRGWLLPLGTAQRRLLLVDDGRQQVQLQFDAQQRLVAGAWMELAPAGPPRSVVFSANRARLEFPPLLPNPKPSMDATRAIQTAVVAPVAEEYELLAIAGPLEGGSYLLGETTRLGRSPENDIVLQDSSVSRCHALIRKSADGYRIFDNGSLHGVTVNGAPVLEPALLRTGDVIRILYMDFVFQPSHARLPRPAIERTTQIRITEHASSAVPAFGPVPGF